jgi:ribosomal protein S28E/S33
MCHTTTASSKGELAAGADWGHVAATSTAAVQGENKQVRIVVISLIYAGIMPFRQQFIVPHGSTRVTIVRPGASRESGRNLTRQLFGPVSRQFIAVLTEECYDERVLSEF